MKILYIVPSLRQTGPIIVVKEIIDNLIELGVKACDITVFYFDKSNEVVFPVVTKQIRLFENINLRKYDIIHSHMLRPDFYLIKECIIDKIRNGKRAYKIITTIHQRNFETLYFETNRKVFAFLISKMWELLFMFYDSVIVLSKSMEKYYLKRIYNGKKVIKVILNGRSINYINIKEASTYENKISRNIKIGTVCNLNKRKNIKIVLYAIKNIENVVYYIIGNGEELKELELLTKRLEIEDKVVFIGYKKNAIEYYYLFDIFVLPSKSEGISLSLIEAAAMKKTIICSDIEPNHDIFSETEALFFDYNNAKDLESKIIYAFNNMASLSKNSYNKYINELKGIKMAEKYYKLYSRVSKLSQD